MVEVAHHAVLQGVGAGHRLNHPFVRMSQAQGMTQFVKVGLGAVVARHRLTVMFGEGRTDPHITTGWMLAWKVGMGRGHQGAERLRPADVSGGGSGVAHLNKDQARHRRPGRHGPACALDLRRGQVAHAGPFKALSVGERRHANHRVAHGQRQTLALTHPPGRPHEQVEDALFQRCGRFVGPEIACGGLGQIHAVLLGAHDVPWDGVGRLSGEAATLSARIRPRA